MKRRRVIHIFTDGWIGLYDPNSNTYCDQEEFPELSNKMWFEIVGWYRERMEILNGWHLTNKQVGDALGEFYNNGITLAKKIQKFVGRKYNVDLKFNTDMFWWDKKLDKLVYK